MNNLPSGVYTHFKDPKKEYEVVGVALHTESREQMVVYRPLYEDAAAELFVRPLSMFVESVDKPEIGYSGPRFVQVRSD
ncbi:DUF1653 domain-containing protein [Patescibacteria group bacterium]|nr:DUF1653 domain-containing protein [Patescibacteria group bacterium]MBU1500855.1 DUF1653 domain-containing protein [Patescibacteria group bacterium]MBU2080910.1 DUF1653 domain-containing protein [Patescibacteria group bacterium]MBU2124015.1 DUF1653 domain-containing protein [Patescibacteria group bacterium]MBU2194694.1 DUF1653 domain-containing protein [Patescibacteria group bacterium]